MLKLRACPQRCKASRVKKHAISTKKGHINRSVGIRSLPWMKEKKEHMKNRIRKIFIVCIAFGFFNIACPQNTTDENADKCPEGTVRVVDVCKDLTPEGSNSNTSRRDASVPLDPPVADGGFFEPMETQLPFYIDEYFAVSGYMGDAEVPGNLTDTVCNQDNATDINYCHEFVLLAGSVGWTGVWWQSPADNWGETAGLGLPIASGARKISFKAWSEQGGEKIEFFAGYTSDGFSATKPSVSLTTQPVLYEMDIHCFEYTRVAGGFGWSVDTAALNGETRIFISDVIWTDEANANPVDCVALEEERLSLGVFYDGPASETIAIDDITRHLYVYDETVSITSTEQAFEGVVANTITYNNLGWWGMGIHWDTAEDLSAWESLNISVKISAENEFQNIKITAGDGTATHVFRLTDYGLLNTTAWQTISMPLSAVSASGVNLNAITLPFEMTGGANSENASFDLDGVYLSKTYTPTAPPEVPDAGIQNTFTDSDAGLGAVTQMDAGVILENDAGNTGEMPLLFEDNFDGVIDTLPDSSKWTYDIGNGDWGWGNQQLEYNTNNATNVSMDGEGHLRITAREENMGSCWHGGACAYTSARINTRNLFSTTYGRIEGRFKMPSGKGLWPAFWMLGTDLGTAGWPACGEIDIFEYRGQEPNKTQGAIHGLGYSGGNAFHGVHNNATPLDADFHVYAVDWEPELIQWSIDGLTYFAVHANQLNGGQIWAFEHPFFMIMNVAVGGTFLDNPDETTIFPQTMLVDYVRVYGHDTNSAPLDLMPFCLDVFHEPPCENMFLVDDETRHYYIYNSSYQHSTSTDAYEGVESAMLTANGGSWWGGGIHSSTPVNMSSYTTMHVALKANSPNFSSVEIRMEADGQSAAVTVIAASYGYSNDGQWHALEIPLTDFTGLDLTNVTGLFMLGGGMETAGAELLVDAVSFE